MCTTPVSLGGHEVVLAPAALMLGACHRQDTLLHVCKHTFNRLMLTFAARRATGIDLGIVTISWHISHAIISA